MKNPLPRLAAFLLFVLLPAGCGGGDGSAMSPEPLTLRQGCSVRHEHELGDEPADLSTAVAVELEGVDGARHPSDTAGAGTDRITYALAAGQSLHLLHHHSPAVSATLYGPDGGTVGTLQQGDELETGALPGGRYTLQLNNQGPATYLHLTTDQCSVITPRRTYETPGVAVMEISLSPEAPPFASSTTVLIGTFAAGSGYANRPVPVSSTSDMESLFGPSIVESRLGAAARAFFAQGGGSLLILAVPGDESSPSVQELIEGVSGLSSLKTGPATLVFPDIPVLSREDAATLYQQAVGATSTQQYLIVGGLPLTVESAADAAGYVDASLPRSSLLALYFPQNGIPGSQELPFDIGALVAAALSRADQSVGPWQESVGSAASLSGFQGPSLAAGDLATLQGSRINALVGSGGGAVTPVTELLAGSDDTIGLVHVRRTVDALAGSVTIFLQPYVFASNTAPTWSTVTAGVSQLLSALGAAGALVGGSGPGGNTAACGLGATMTAQDILDGYLILALTVRPVGAPGPVSLTFTQTLN